MAINGYPLINVFEAYNSYLLHPAQNIFRKFPKMAFLKNTLILLQTEIVFKDCNMITCLLAMNASGLVLPVFETAFDMASLFTWKLSTPSSINELTSRPPSSPEIKWLNGVLPRVADLFFSWIRKRNPDPVLFYGLILILPFFWRVGSGLSLHGGRFFFGDFGLFQRLKN